MRKADRLDEQRLWDDFSKGPSEVTRKRLLTYYFPWVLRVATKLAGSNGMYVNDLDDLASIGLAEIDQCLNTFAVDRGVRFTTYAHRRVWGSMYDYLRSANIISRGGVKERRERNEGIARLTQELGRRPSTEEIEQELGPPPEGMPRPWGVSLDRKLYETDTLRDVTCLHLMECAIEPEVTDIATDNRLAMLMRPMDLPTTVIAYLYFRCDCTLKEIGEIMHLSESRMSQMLSQGKVHIRERFPSMGSATEAMA